MQNDNETYSRCMRYDVDWTTATWSTTTMTENYSVLTYSLVPNASWSTVPCDHGWEYEISQTISSIVIDVRVVFPDYVEIHIACHSDSHEFLELMRTDASSRNKSSDEVNFRISEFDKNRFRNEIRFS